MVVSGGWDAIPLPNGKAGWADRQKGKWQVKKKKYEADLPRRMYTFFHTYSDVGAPSFSKFARSIGATLEDIEGWRGRSEFMRAYRECSEIRRDYLIDNALGKRFDASLVKFLLTNEFHMEDERDKAGEGRLEVTVEVIDK